MNHISSDIILKEINLSDSKKLYELMFEIYPPVYKHLWLDKGESYLNELYSKDNLKNELQNQNSRYYFVVSNNINIGILRILLNEPINTIENGLGIKIHRIYLHPSIHGKGFGKRIFNWIETEFGKMDYSYFWLEAMDTQDSAIKFYEKMGFSIVSSFKLDANLMLENYKGMYRMVKEVSKEKK
ncbi:GNAT family N-acetyltransferase [Aquimarina sp. W85]|uniref:GNAT family N-acetyltransferase n=1 Tax=Aquimarina rhodophyticola TaxID=3342246 RepID=UPI00366B8151